MVSYIEVVVDPDPSDLSIAKLGEVGRTIREFHDAVESFVPPPAAVWNVAIPPDAEDIVCHHDLAPWNLVRTAQRLVIIDWDGAGPGPGCGTWPMPLTASCPFRRARTSTMPLDADSSDCSLAESGRCTNCSPTDMSTTSSRGTDCGTTVTAILGPPMPAT